MVRSVPRVVVIGCGSTGCATAYDLALRGLQVIAVDRGEVASGTTGRNHCLLHSGARYAVKDPESAAECIGENLILRRIMPWAMELNGGMFVALNESDLAYKEQFLDACSRCGIPAQEIPVQRALQIEPNLNPKALAAVLVPDGVFEPYRLCLSFLAGAKTRGASVRLFTAVIDITQSGRSVSGVRVRSMRSGQEEVIGADVVVNAAGPWAGKVAALAGVDVPVVPTAGVMVAVRERLNCLVINRLNEPGDGDIVVPQRRTSIVGTTSWRVEDPDLIPIPADHVDRMLESGDKLLPGLRRMATRGIFAVARPLLAQRGVASEGRELSRTFECFDHAADGVEGLVTITGGKTTTARAMAEKAADIVCAKLGLQEKCRTSEFVLPYYRNFYC
ncbi:MAG: FAD-dependent oxidoreductase [Bacillota bacterium]